MKSQKELKQFAQHCKDIATLINLGNGRYYDIRIESNGCVYAQFDFCSDDGYSIDITPYLSTPISELQFRRAERLRLEQRRLEVKKETEFRMREQLERKEYERLKAKFETLI